MQVLQHGRSLSNLRHNDAAKMAVMAAMFVDRRETCAHSPNVGGPAANHILETGDLQNR